ncbi:hypothetical protein MJ8_01120 [Mesorhizobium sp. J8]|nr:hypothetical protein MJ8_01120 [Mesorhizobium sp. J8]
MVVVEGNRRLCAIKLLLDRTLIPATHRNSFPAPTAEVSQSLRTLSVDLLPDRVAAEPVITRRHTTFGVKQWGVLQKIRRTQRYWEKFKSLDLVSDTLGFSKADVARDIREFALVDLGLTLPRWTKAEKARLNDIHLSANPYIRFISRQDVRDALGVAFNADFKLELTKNRERTKRAVEHIVRQFLLPLADGGPPPKNTRANEMEELAEINRIFESSENDVGAKDQDQADEKSGEDQDAGQDNAESSGGKDRDAVRDPFFKTLRVTISDPAVHVVASEIKKVTPNRPLTACLLLRGLVETVFAFRLDEKGLLPPNVKNGRGPAINSLVNSVIANYNELGLSWGVHAAVVPNSTEVKRIANHLRVVLQKLP